MVKVTSRRFSALASRGFNHGPAYLSDGEKDDEDDEDDIPVTKSEQERSALLKKVRLQVREQLKGLGTKEEINNVVKQLSFLSTDPDGKPSEFPIEQLREMADKEKGVMAIVTRQGLELNALKLQIKAQPKDLSIRSQVEGWFETNKDAIAKLKNRDQAGKALTEFNLELAPFGSAMQQRAAADSPMLPSTVMPGGTDFITRFEVQPGINQLLRPEPTFWDFIKKGQTSAETYVWINKRPTDGAAAFIAPGVYKPAVSFKIARQTSHAKKIAVNEKVAMELLEDIDGFVTWVEDELRYQLMIKVNSVMGGAGAGDDETPTGILNDTVSVPFNHDLGVQTTKANIWDAIKAQVVQLRVGLFMGQIVTRLHPVDLANAIMTKAQNQGQLFIPPVTGSSILEDVNFTQGYLHTWAVDYYKTLIYKGFTMRWGWENQDFTENLSTVIGEMRLHNFFSSNYAGFSIYDTIQNVIDAINQPINP